MDRQATLRERWERSCGDLRAALLARAPSDRVTWVAGELAARTLGTTRLAETWIHTGDVADGLGATLEPADRLWHVAHLAWRTIPYAFDRAGEPPPGPVAFELVAPSGGQWSFGESAPTVIRGPGYDLCRVASRRVDAVGHGPHVHRARRRVGPPPHPHLGVSARRLSRRSRSW